MSISNHQQNYQIPVVEFLNSVVRRVAETTAWFNMLLVLVILTQVIMRYGFNRGMVPLEELMWHLYAIAFMFGMAYAITNDSHIRVDIVHMSLSPKAQHIIEILGILFLLMPFLWVLFDHSLSWAMDAFRVNESSQNPTGLPYRWIIKSVVPISAFLMFLAALARLIQEVLLLVNKDQATEEQFSGRVSAMRRFFHVNTIENSDSNLKGEKSNDS